MADPRIALGFQFVTGPEAVFGADNSIDLPVFANGNNLSVSSSLSKLVTYTSTSTYAAPDAVGATLPTVGLGTIGQRIAGQVLVVDPEGYVTILKRGYVLASVNTGNPPTVGNLVAVDGLGNAVGSSAAAASNAVCVGFCYNSNQAVFQHLAGNITVPTTVQTGPEAVILDLG